MTKSKRIKIDDPELIEALTTTVFCRCPKERQDRRTSTNKTAVHDWCYYCGNAIPKKETPDDET